MHTIIRTGEIRLHPGGKFDPPEAVEALLQNYETQLADCSGIGKQLLSNQVRRLKRILQQSQQARPPIR